MVFVVLDITPHVFFGKHFLWKVNKKYKFQNFEQKKQIFENLQKKMNYPISLNSIKKIFLFWGSDALDKLWLIVVWVLKPIFMFAILLSIKQPLKVKTAVK